MAYSALGPVSQAVFAQLQDATLAAALPGGWHDDVVQSATYPVGWYEVHARDYRGLGSGELVEVDLRTHIFSKDATMAAAQEANRLTIGRLKDQAVTVTGYAQGGLIFWDETIQFPDAELNGVKVHEIVSLFRIYLEVA